MNCQQIEIELSKLQVLPTWGRMQQNDWDKKSNFVYTLPSYDELQTTLSTLDKSQEFNNYCIHRWFNTLSAIGVEQIFCSHKDVVAHKNKYDKLVDFALQGIPFDHKTTVFPKGYPYSLAYAEENPSSLINWLYKQQSKEGRFHTGNRLFVVLHAENGEHWRYRAKLSLLKPIILKYLDQFEPRKLFRLEMDNQANILSDIIWVKDIL